MCFVVSEVHFNVRTHNEICSCGFLFSFASSKEPPFGFSGLFPQSLEPLKISDTALSTFCRSRQWASAPTMSRRIRVALLISNARLIYRSHSKAAAIKLGTHLNRTRSTHQTASSAPFLPHLFRQGGKDGAAGGIPSPQISLDNLFRPR